MNDPISLLSQRGLFEKYSKRKKHLHSSYSFVNIFLWKDFFDFHFQVIDDSLCIFAKNEIGCFLYLPPLSSHISKQAVSECFGLMREMNGNNGVSRIENVEEEDIRYFEKDDFKVFNKCSEYCYLRQDIVELKGNRYKSKRSSYNKFVNNYRYELLDYEPSMADECSDLFVSWSGDRKEKYADDVFISMIEENEKVHKLAFESYDDLGLTGKVVVVDNKIKAYTFGYKLNDECFCILFEIADLKVKGLPMFIFREFCYDEYLRPYKYINVMDDFGLENIGGTKLSFCPTVMVPSFIVYKR